MRNHFRFLVQVVLIIGFSQSFAGTFTDFFRALDRDDARSVAGYLKQGFDPNAAGEDGQTALYAALRDGSSEVAAVLLADPRLQPDLANATGETPLMMAALRGDLASARRLIERGAVVNRPGWSPLHYAASGPEPKVVALLLDRGASIDSPAPNGATALMLAAQYGAQDTAVLLLTRGANPRLKNVHQQGAADFARMADRDRLAERLEQAAR